MANFFKAAKNANREGNVRIFPVNNEAFNNSLASCEGLLTGGGFEGPAEALFLQKKVLMIPNEGSVRTAVQCFGCIKARCACIHEIDDHFVYKINKWISDDKKIEVNFPDETALIVDNMIKRYAKQ